MNNNDKENPNMSDDWSENKDKEDFCPYTEMMMSAILCGKPFGMLWPEETMMEFLKKRGYKIVGRYDEDKEKNYNVAVKSEDLAIDDTGFSNINRVFEKEIQLILMDWLLKI